MPSLPWINTREVRLLEPRIGFYLDPTLRAVIEHSHVLNAHKVGEIQADTRITLPLMYALYSVLNRYERGIQRKLIFAQKWLNRQGRGSDVDRLLLVGTCCKRGMPSIYELPVYVSAIQQLMEDSSYLEADMHRSTVLSDVYTIERGSLQRQVRSLKRQSEHYESFAFSCPNCYADRQVYLTPKTPRVIALRCWYKTLLVHWGCLAKWLNSLLNARLTVRGTVRAPLHSESNLLHAMDMVAHKALFAMIDTLFRHNLLKFRVNDSRTRLMLFTPPRSWFINIVASRCPPGGEIMWGWPHTEALNVITEQVEAGNAPDVVLTARRDMIRLPYANRRTTNDSTF